MELSAAGLKLLKRSEGFSSHIYKDVNGFPTIGYGHRLRPQETYPAGVAEAQGAEMLIADVREAERAVLRLAKVPLTQGQFDALVDFCFNLGAGRLASSTLLKILNGGRYNDASEQLLCWDIAAGVENAGLKARRQAEFDLWRGGIAAADSVAGDRS
jgi:lysozyme